MVDQREGVLTYKCPHSGRIVATSIVTDNTTLTRVRSCVLSVWCPHCGTPHKIVGKEAALIYPVLAAAE